MNDLTDIQTVFVLSTVNGADNCQELLPHNGWEWPKDTFLERRLKQLRTKEGSNEQTDR